MVDAFEYSIQIIRMPQTLYHLTEESSWFRIITECTAAEVCVTVWFPGLCWKSAEGEEEKQHYDETNG